MSDRTDRTDSFNTSGLPLVGDTTWGATGAFGTWPKGFAWVGVVGNGLALGEKEPVFLVCYFVHQFLCLFQNCMLFQWGKIKPKSMFSKAPCTKNREKKFTQFFGWQLLIWLSGGFIEMQSGSF